MSVHADGCAWCDRCESGNRQLNPDSVVVMTERVRIAKWLRTLPNTTSPAWIADKLELGEIGFF